MIKYMDQSTISAKIRKRRLETGLSLSQLARRVNTSVATLSRYENGWQRFEIYTLRKIATALGCRLIVDMEPLEDQAAESRERSEFKGLQRLFWDCRLEEKDIEQYPPWVVERVLEFGSLKDVRYIENRLGRRRFLETIERARFSS
jgi:transcriptional regulator with XRE-family HTH domain